MQLWRWMASAVQQLSAAFCHRDRAGGRMQNLRRPPHSSWVCGMQFPKPSLAQSRVSSTLSRNAVKPFLSLNGQQISLAYKLFLCMEAVLCLRKSVIYIQITFLILVMASFIVDQGMVRLGRLSLLFSHVRRSISNCEIEFNQAVWNPGWCVYVHAHTHILFLSKFGIFEGPFL